MSDAEKSLAAIRSDTKDKVTEQPDEATRLALIENEKLTPTKRADVYAQFIVGDLVDQRSKLTVERDKLLAENRVLTSQVLHLSEQVSSLRTGSRWRTWFEIAGAALPAIGGVCIGLADKPHVAHYIGITLVAVGSVIIVWSLLLNASRKD